MTGGIGEFRPREIQAGVNTGFPLCSSTLKAIIEPFGAAPFIVEPFKFDSSSPQTGASTVPSAKKEPAVRRGCHDQIAVLVLAPVM